ncbi:MAG TPA: alpha/beta hydrolase [Stellaceae bacterium]
MRHARSPALWVESGGAGGPMLVMLHGLGANGTVWERMRPIVEARWPGRWLVPDLRGHGRSGHGAPYGLGMHAADVASLLQESGEVVLLGHSMGGAVAMALGSGWFGRSVRHVIAFGVKLAWTPEEVAKAQEIARMPTRWFATREEAVERYLRVAGLKGLVDPGSPAADIGIVEEEDRFRLAADPRINDVAGPPIEDVIAAMRAPLRLAAGERDPMVTLAQMRRFDQDATVIAGVGHNPHVEAPETVWRLVEDALG